LNRYFALDKEGITFLKKIIHLGEIYVTTKILPVSSKLALSEECTDTALVYKKHNSK